MSYLALIFVLLGVLLLPHAALALKPAADPEYDTRQTVTGPVKGVVNTTSNCRSWKGMPFAADTGGENRWKGPITRDPWEGTWDGTLWGPGCAQIHGGVDTPKQQSEDCLNVNVFSPMGATGEKNSSSYPVIVWWHGGTFIEGWNEGPFDLYDGCILSDLGDVVVVTANYRLGALGYLVTDELGGNMGFLDQRAALEWVQENIANFGGDPKQVTMMGESAGASSVGLHVLSPNSQGLFDKAIMESNFPGMPLHTIKQAKNMGMTFCRDLNCTTGGNTIWNSQCDHECMRNADIEDVKSAWSSSADAIVPLVIENAGHLLEAVVGFGPAIGDEDIPYHTVEGFEKGANDINVPLLFGTNTGEGETFIYFIDEALPLELAHLAMDIIFYPNGTDVYNMYTGLYPDATDGREIISKMGTDFAFRCSSQVMASSTVGRGGTAFQYRYNHVFSGSQLFPQFGLPEECVDIACHASEIPFVFNNAVPVLNATFQPDELILAQQMGTYWTNFVHTGNPNKGPADAEQTVDLPFWPAWAADTQYNIFLDIDPYKEDTMVETCGFWDQIGYDFVYESPWMPKLMEVLASKGVKVLKQAQTSQTSF